MTTFIIGLRSFLANYEVLAEEQFPGALASEPVAREGRVAGSRNFPAMVVI
jgi:hypothetical protein